MKRIGGLTALLVAGIAALVAGCGGVSTPTVDPARIEPQLITHLAQDAGVSPKGVTLHCPSDEPAVKGTRFECLLTAAGGTTARVDVWVTSAHIDGDQVDYHVEAKVPKSQFD